MQLYDTLTKYQKQIDYHKSEDFYYYLNNRHLLNDIEMYRFLLDARNEFDIIRANIIIQALKNKERLEKAIVYAYRESKMKTDEVSDFIHEQMAGLPYIQENNMKIFVPIFSRAINIFYYQQFGKLLQDPYAKLLTNYQSSCIDPFELFNFSLYDSLFTKFITILKTDKLMVLYHFDFRSIYFVNDQGRLDAKIALFDKYIKRPKTEHVIERIKPVIDCYINNDREGLYKALIDNELISRKLIYKIKHKEFKFKRTLERKIK